MTDSAAAAQLSEEFAKAFLAAQKEFPSIHKGRTAKIETQKGSYSYSYADLGDVLDVALPVLHKHGLWLSQPPVSEQGQVGVETRIGHTSGHVEPMGRLLLPAGNSPQTAGSAMTYARRYAACAALGIVADEDDDGAAASQVAPEVRLENRLKNKAMELAAGDKEFAATIFANHVPAELTPESVAQAEKEMEDALGA